MQQTLVIPETQILTSLRGGECAVDVWLQLVLLTEGAASLSAVTLVPGPSVRLQGELS